MYKRIWVLVIIIAPLQLIAQAATEIYLFKLAVNDTNVVLSQPRNISNHKGYDNQPHFHPSLPLIYFSSFDDSSRSDIKYYNIKTAVLSNFTKTREREYSPTITPDKAFISAIVQRDNGVQDLAKFPIKGGAPTLLINNLKVGYHAWINDVQLLLFVLKDSTTNELHHYHLKTKQSKVIAPAPGRSLHKIPGEQAMSFIEKSSKDKWTLKRLDIKTGSITTITSIPPYEDIAWTRNGLVLLSNEDEIMVYNPKRNTWTKAVIEVDGARLKKITRMAINHSDNSIALVAAE